MKDYRIIDLHAHPSLKLYYFPYLLKNFKIKTFSGPFFNPFGLRTRYGNINKSPVKVIINAHYVIERDFVKEGFKKYLRYSLYALAPAIMHKILKDDPYQALLNQFKTLEKAVLKSSKFSSLKNKVLKMVYDVKDIEELKDNEVGIIHAIEGAHALGYKPQKNETNEEFLNKITERVKYLKMKGLAVIGISHFWDNMYLPQTDGTEIVAKKVKGKLTAVKDDKLVEMKRGTWKFGDSTKLSYEFINLLLNNGILIDLSHTQEHARKKVYDICSKFKKPVIVSHVGLKHFFKHEYNLSDEELLKIHELQGIVGLIFSKRWLVSPLNRKKRKGGIDDLIESMKYIKKITKDVSIIGIGTDFDGFTTPFKDLYTYAQFKKLIDKMKNEFTEDEINDILYNNALRVLKAGWINF